MGISGTHHCDVFEAQESFPAKVVRRLRLPNEDHIFYTDTEAPVRVIPGFCKSHPLNIVHGSAAGGMS